MPAQNKIGDLIRCVICDKEIRKKASQHICCSSNCSHTNWARRNREHLLAYNKAWQSKNPNAVAAYNENRRKGWSKMPCKFCGKVFEKSVSRRLYCSNSCRNREKWKSSDFREKSAVAGSVWRENNRELLRKRSKTYFRTYFERTAGLHPWMYLFRGAKQRAKKSGVAFDLDDAWGRQRWTGKCELTGMDFSPPEKRKGSKLKNLSPSIDRIEASGGYTKDNCRFVLWAVNSFKSDSPDADMYRIAEALIANMPSIFRSY